MRSFLVIGSILAAVVAVAAIVVTLATQPTFLGLRLVASVLLMDQATLALLSLKLPMEVRGIRLALRAGSALAIVGGAAVLVACALPHPGPAEIVMPLVGILMVLHGALTLRWLQGPSRPETA